MAERPNLNHPVVRRRVVAELYDQVVKLAALSKQREGYIVYRRDGQWVRHHEECGWTQWGEAQKLAYRLRDNGADEVFLVSCLLDPERPSVTVLIEEYDRPAIAERGFDRLLPTRLSALAA